MKQINNYILEKLVINKDSKLKPHTELNLDNEQMVTNIIKASFISLYKQYFLSASNKSIKNPFANKSLAKFSIVKRNIDYKGIIEVLNNYYDYNFLIEEAEDQSKIFNKLIRSILFPLEDLINFKTVRFPIISVKINGKEVYDKDWKDYAIKNNISC